MGLDIRLPIGLMFSILGALLAVYGLLSPASLYEEHSLGINVNLWWGLVMAAFGGAMAWFGLRAMRRPRVSPGPPGPPSPERREASTRA